MSTRAEILLEDLSESIGIPNLQFDADNLCSLLIDGTYQITLMANSEEVIFLYGVLGKYPEHLSNALTPELMSMSLVLSETSGPYFGLEPFSKALLLASTIRLDGLTLQEFEQHIEGMVEFQKRVSEFLADKGIILEPLEVTEKQR